MSEGMSYAGSRRPGGVITRLSVWSLVGLVAALLLATGCVPSGQFTVSGWGGAVPANDLVFAATATNQLIALGAADGGERWRFTGMSGEPLQGVFASPSAADGLVYLGAYNKKVYALSAADGTVQWQRSADGPVIGSPVLAGDRLLVPTGNGEIRTFNRTTGEPGWRFSIKQKIWASPTVSGDRVYVAGMDHNLYALSLADGQVLWTYPTGGAIAGQPLAVDDLVVVGSFDRKLHAVDARGGTERWTYPAATWFWAGPVSDGDRIYAAALDGTVFALDKAGKFLWEYKAPGSIVSRPAVVEAGLLVVTDQGRFSLVSTRGLEQWPYDARDPNSKNTSVRGPIATAGSVAYLSTRQPSQVIALDTERKQVLWKRSTDTK